MKNKLAKPGMADPTLTLKEIDQQIAQLRDQAAHIVTSEKPGVVARIKDAIAYYGITAAELGFGERSKPGRTQPARAGTPAKRGKAATADQAAEPAASVAVGAPAPKGRVVGRIKFKDDAGHTWSGYGPKPQWFVAALASGKTPQDLAA
ncbi:MAG TPA: H-NS histone family protein [Pseudorhodoferax sp.]|nr:H-NS histone family protein [Pseudorhodoferax sp.]